MNKIVFNIIIIVFAIVLNSFGNSFEGKGQKVFPFLKINPSINSSGFAGSNAATMKGIQSAYLNPAGLGAVDAPQVYAQYTKWVDEMNIGYISFAKQVSQKNILGISLGYLQYPDQMETIVDNTNQYNYTEIGDFSASSGFVGMHVAGKINHKLLGGIGLKYISQKIGDFKTVGTFAFDLGFIANTTPYATYGISLNNVSWGAKYGAEWEPLPVSLRIGGEWEYAPESYGKRRLNEWKYSFELCSELFFGEGININGGLEIIPYEFLAFRTGYSYSLESNKYEGLGGASIGAALLNIFEILGTDIEYALNSLGRLGLVHRLGIKIEI